MKDNYFKTIWGTIMSCFNYSGKATRTEYAYFWLFSYSIGLLYWVFFGLVNNIFGLVNNNGLMALLNLQESEHPLINVILIFSFRLIFLCLGFASISLSFRRCRDFGATMVGLLQFVPIINLFLPPFLMFIKSKDSRDDKLLQQDEAIK